MGLLVYHNDSNISIYKSSYTVNDIDTQGAQNLPLNLLPPANCFVPNGTNIVYPVAINGTSVYIALPCNSKQIVVKNYSELFNASVTVTSATRGSDGWNITFNYSISTSDTHAGWTWDGPSTASTPENRLRINVTGYGESGGGEYNGYLEAGSTPKSVTGKTIYASGIPTSATTLFVTLTWLGLGLSTATTFNV
ncbi:MAG: hypothetical protein HUJ98_04125 [Bacteroidaceae bacterium]|nr:hypothetical protein [Bacteroidaceae bacterium]